MRSWSLILFSGSVKDEVVRHYWRVIVTTSKALVTTSMALVFAISSFCNDLERSVF